MIERDVIKKIKKVMNEYRIPILVGLRRVGKTTLLKQIQAAEPNAIYIKCDSVMTIAMSDIELYSYCKTLIENGCNVLLLDEIQARENWDRILKDLYDEYLQDKKLRVVAAGSSTIYYNNNETGVTRTNFIGIHSLSYPEYLRFKGITHTNEAFEEFLTNGGYIEALNGNWSIEEQKNNILDPIVTKDLPAIFNIKTDNIAKLLKELSLLTNGEFLKTKFCAQFSVSTQQVDHYIDILEKSSLIKVLYQVDENGQEGRYKKFKIYINPHIHVWLLGKHFNSIDNKFKGHIIESYWYFMKEPLKTTFSHWHYMKERASGKEIDFVKVSTDSTSIFSEVHEFKYKDSITLEDQLNLIKTSSLKKYIWTKGKVQIEYIQSKSIYDHIDEM